MEVDDLVQPTVYERLRKLSVRTFIGVACLVLLIVSGVGFVHFYLHNRRIQSELDVVQWKLHHEMEDYHLALRHVENGTTLLHNSLFGNGNFSTADHNEILASYARHRCRSPNILPLVFLYLDTHKDVVTNGLDLFGFILVTPQLLHLMDLLLSLIFIIILTSIYILVCAGICYTLYWLIAIAMTPVPVIIGIPIGMGALILSVSGMITVLVIIIDNRRGIWIASGRYMFPTGVTLFFLSRVLALGVALFGTL